MSCPAFSAPPHCNIDPQFLFTSVLYDTSNCRLKTVEAMTRLVENNNTILALVSMTANELVQNLSKVSMTANELVQNLSKSNEKSKRSAHANNIVHSPPIEKLYRWAKLSDANATFWQALLLENDLDNFDDCWHVQ